MLNKLQIKNIDLPLRHKLKNKQEIKTSAMKWVGTPVDETANNSDELHLTTKNLNAWKETY